VPQNGRRWPIWISISTSATGGSERPLLINARVTAKMLQAADIKDTDNVWWSVARPDMRRPSSASLAGG